MSREAFEAWARENHITFVSRSSGQHTTDTVSRDALRNLWQAATAAALEEAADVCRKLGKEGKPDNPEYGSWGEFDDAEQAIRALKDHPND